jgi:hypothetical protein
MHDCKEKIAKAGDRIIKGLGQRLIEGEETVEEVFDSDIAKRSGTYLQNLKGIFEDECRDKDTGDGGLREAVNKRMNAEEIKAAMLKRCAQLCLKRRHNKKKPLKNR